jgi:hypothetical protein
MRKGRCRYRLPALLCLAALLAGCRPAISGGANPSQSGDWRLLTSAGGGMTVSYPQTWRLLSNNDDRLEFDAGKGATVRAQLQPSPGQVQEPQAQVLEDMAQAAQQAAATAGLSVQVQGRQAWVAGGLVWHELDYMVKPAASGGSGNARFCIDLLAFPQPDVSLSIHYERRGASPLDDASLQDLMQFAKAIQTGPKQSS